MDEKLFNKLDGQIEALIKDGILDDDTSFDLKAANLSGLDQLQQLHERGYFSSTCLFENGGLALDAADFSPIFEAQQAVMRALLELADAPPVPKDMPQAVEQVGGQILSLYQAIDTVAPATIARPALMTTWASNQLTYNLATPTFFASMLPDWQVPTAEVLRLLQLLYEELQEAANVAKGQFGAGARVLLARLAQFMRTLRNAGSTINLAAVMTALRSILPQLLELLRGSLTADRFRLVLQAVLRFSVGLAELIPGGAAAGGVAGAGGATAGGGAAGAGGATAGGGAAAGLGAAAWNVLLILAAFGLGCLIGWFIGQIKIGDKTIHEWLGDCFYWLILAPPAACETVYRMSVAMGNRAREARRKGDKLAEKTALTAQIEFLTRYIDLACEEHMSIYRRQLKRLRGRLAKLK